MRLATTSRMTLQAALIYLFGVHAPVAQTSAEKHLPLDGNIAANGSAVELNWFDADPPRVGSVTIKRRIYGQTGGESWKPLATGLGPVMRYLDDTVRPGVAYEYQVLRQARDIVDVGYWLTGVEVPAQDRRGNVHLVVEKGVAEALAPRLKRFEQDLIGDGWNVSRFIGGLGDVSRPLENLKTAVPVKQWLQSQYQKDPFGQHTIILIGHIPIIQSGKARPDGHDARPQPSDLFYADIDGVWRLTREGQVMHNSLPDSKIEMQVGRIDLIYLSNSDRAVEMDMLRAYFDKNHHWRMGLLGDLRKAYGQSDHLYAEQYGLRNIVGPRAVTAGGHHDVGEREPWLWGVDFGDYNGRNYLEKYENKAVFAINFGSAKQRIDLAYGAMIALLAQPWYTLAVGWGGRPAWWLHHMALGGSIGDVHMRTVNNGIASEPYRSSMDYYPTGNYLWRNPVWINLMGDPTLGGFPLAPVSDVRARATEQGVKLTWEASPDPDVTGYHIYRMDAETGAYRPLTVQGPVEALEFTDPDGQAPTDYMVRAYGLKDVYAGSFYTFSQGRFSSERPLSETNVDAVPEVEGVAGQPVPLPAVFNQVTDGRIYAFIEGPDSGTLRRAGPNWVYTPRAGFTGHVSVRYSVSDARDTVEKTLTIKITE